MQTKQWHMLVVSVGADIQSNSLRIRPILYIFAACVSVVRTAAKSNVPLLNVPRTHAIKKLLLRLHAFLSMDPFLPPRCSFSPYGPFLDRLQEPV